VTFVGREIVFLHVPKTGGTWAFHAMSAAGVTLREVGMHADLRAVGVHDSLFYIAFVREPLSWYRSWWTHRHTFQDWREDEPLDQIGRARFEDFLAEAITRHHGYVSDLFEQFTGHPGSEINFVGRYENLVDDLVQGLRAAGVAFDEERLRTFPPLNVSSTDLECRCAPTLVHRLKEAERRAYERFYPDRM
jgi:hypothetical protein